MKVHREETSEGPLVRTTGRVHTIAVDVRVADERREGVERVAAYELRLLHEVAASRPAWRFVLVRNDLTPNAALDPLLALPTVSVATYETFRGSTVDLLHILAPLEALRGGDPWLTAAPGVPATASILDGEASATNEEATRARVSRLHQLDRSGLVFLTATEVMRQRLMTEAQLPYDVTASLGVGTDVTADDTPPTPHAIVEAKTRLGIGGPYFLHAAPVGDQTNIEMILVGLSQAWTAGHLVWLVFAGEPTPLSAVVAERLRARGVAEIVFTGAISTQDLAALRAGATAEVYVPNAAPMGGGAVPAIAAGACVIASDIAMHRELFGNAPFYVAAGAPRELGAAMIHLLQNTADVRTRRMMSQAASRDLSWSTVANNLVTAWHAVLGELVRPVVAEPVVAQASQQAD